MAGVPMSLDFGAIMAVGAAQGADVELLAEVLSPVETAILSGAADQDSEE